MSRHNQTSQSRTPHQNGQQPPLGFGHKGRVDEINLQNTFKDRIYKKLYQPEYLSIDPNDPTRTKYTHYDPEELRKQQQLRRMDRKVIKLEVAYGSERTLVLIKRDHDLTVRDIMDEITRVYQIPLAEQSIYYRGMNLCDYPNETLENLGVENNNQVRINRETDASRAKNVKQSPSQLAQHPPPPSQQQMYQAPPQPQQVYQQPPPPQQNVYSPRNDVSNQLAFNEQEFQKGISSSNQANSNTPRDILKLYVTYGSEREYIIVHGRRPLMVHDLKNELCLLFKIPNDKQSIVFKGHYIHEYVDDTPLDAFGLENNSQLSVWYKPDEPVKTYNERPVEPVKQDIPYNSPRNNYSTTTPRWTGPMNADAAASNEVFKVDVQHGSDRYQVILKGHERNLTVTDLQNEVERLTFIPIANQRIFYKSQELNLAPHRTLKEFDLQNNSMLRVIGEATRHKYYNY